MMEVGQFNDVEWMNSLCRDEHIYPCLGDDASPAKEDFSVEVFDVVPHRFLEVKEDGKRIGFFAFIEAASGIWEQHTILGMECRGRKALEAGTKALEWVEANCHPVAFSSYCTSDQPASMWYAKKLGYDQGNATSTIMRGGKPARIIAFTRQPRTNLCPS